MSPATALLSSPQLQVQHGARRSARPSTAAMLSVDAQDKDGWTALHAAAYASDTRCVALLLRAGAESQVVDGAGQSPADVAQAQGAGKIAGVLRGELSNDVLEASGLLENRMDSSRNGSNVGPTGGRSSKDGKFRSQSPGLSGGGKTTKRRGEDVESGLLGGAAVVESSDSSDDDNRPKEKQAEKLRWWCQPCKAAGKEKSFGAKKSLDQHLKSPRSASEEPRRQDCRL